MPSDVTPFSIMEESGFFRLNVGKPEVRESDVEDFLDTTVEWLSTGPDKGILIDFNGVKEVCTDFVIHLLKYYEDIKARGLYVRFVNVDPILGPSMDVSNITVVLSADMLPSLGENEKAVVSAKEVLDDVTEGLSDKQLMNKYGLSEKGLTSLYRKLLEKGLITKKIIAQRWGVETAGIEVSEKGPEKRKVTVKAQAVMRDLEEGLSDIELMKKYKLSKKGLQSMWRKLIRQGLVSREMLSGRTFRADDL